MSDVSIKINYKTHGHYLEIEISGSKEDVDFFLTKILDRFYVSQISESRMEEKRIDELKDLIDDGNEIPSIKISKSDSLSDILTKIFNSGWGRSPRGLREVISTLESLGLYYPKSTIAVTLKRLVEKGVLRRIRGKDGVFRYVVSRPSSGEV